MKTKEIKVKNVLKQSKSLKKLTAQFGIDTLTSAEKDLMTMKKILKENKPTSYIVYQGIKLLHQVAKATGACPPSSKNIKITRTEVANLLGFSRQLVSKSLEELQTFGIIEINGKYITFK